MDEAEVDYAALVTAILSDQNATAYEMAKRAGLTQQAVLDITKGNRPNPRVETIRKLLLAAGKPWGWIDEWLATVREGSTDQAAEPEAKPAPKKGKPKK